MNSVSPAKADEPIEMSGCGLVGPPKNHGGNGKGHFWGDILGHAGGRYTILSVIRVAMWPLATISVATRYHRDHRPAKLSGSC